MKKTWIIVFVMSLFLTFQVFGQNLANEQLENAKKMIINKTDTVAIQNLISELEPKNIKNKQEATELFKKRGYPVRKVFKDGKVIELQGFENGRPYFYTTYNNVAANTVSTNKIKPGGVMGLNLRGENIDIGLWDEASVYTYHTEFKETNNGPYHAYYVDTAAQVFGDHATHVAGTLVAWGKQSNAKGMAEKSDVRSYNWDMDLSEMSNEVINNALLLSNHSYGKIAGWDKQDTSWYWVADDFDVIDPAFGNYDSSAWNLDKLAYLSPYYNIIFSAGNQRDEGPEDNAYHHVWINGEFVGSTKYRPKDGIDGFKSIAHEVIAKNIIVVGAIDDIPAGYQTVSDVKQDNADFSGWGPTNDGRIKPDIVANGDNLYSTLSGGNNYGSMSGTSMAAPNLTGSLALLLQHYYQTHSNSYPLASTVKAIIIHTADEAGSALGPDAKYGWGLLNTASAAKIISEDQSKQNIIRELELSSGQIISQQIYSKGTKPLKITIAWTDRAPANLSTSVLVNDLDIRLKKGSAINYPFVIDMSSANYTAKTADNSKDNVEQIYLQTLSEGFYTVEITHKRSLAANQTFSIIITGDDNPVSELTIKQLDEALTPFGKAAYWNGASWSQVNPTDIITMNLGLNRFLSTYDFKPSTFQKFNRWTDNDGNIRYRNWDTLSTNGNTTFVNSNFTTAKNATILAAYEGMPNTTDNVTDSIYFKDPWFYDLNESPYGNRNRGPEAVFKSASSPLVVATTSNYKGVFLNQSVGSGIYYSLRAPLTQTVNLGGTLGSQSFSFFNWYSPGATFQQVGTNPSGYDEKAVVFTAADAVVQANYKGHLLSGNSSAFSTNSQRKVVRDEVGRLNMVYESMGYVWLTVSSDNGATWSPEIKINYVESFITGTATKCPSIVQSDDNTGKVYIAYQFDYGDSSSGIAVSAYFNGDHRWTALVADSSISYSYNTNPVIAVRSNKLHVVFRISSTGGLLSAKISVNGTGDPEVSYKAQVPNSTASSINPAITSGVNTQGYYKFHLAYQEGTSAINYLNWNPDSYPSDTPVNVSSGSGYTYKSNPSIIQLGDGVRIAWKGYNSTGNAAAVFKDPGYYRFWNFDAGNGISSSSVTRTTDGNYVVGWTLQSGLSNRFVTNADFNNIRTFKTTANVNLAGNLQVANGSAFTDMYAMSLNTQTSPYSFQISKKVSDIGLGKVSGEDLTYKGRGAVLYKDNAEVYFSLNDITSDGSVIDFVEAEDTLKITESGVLNKYLETKPFNVNSNSELVYGISYGTIDSSALAALLDENSFISFKVEMVDAKTNTVLSTLEDIEYSKIKLAVSGEKAVKVNLSDIGSKEIKLRVTLNDNIDAIYALVDKISTSENIAKTNIQEVKYTGLTVIKEYGLMQNYPNPFNPTTTITYQLPKDGMVTLKIYDAIGTEVTTLVHEYKSTGKYNVNFNASNLASGVYFYRLQVNDFSSSKKLILMK